MYKNKKIEFARNLARRAIMAHKQFLLVWFSSEPTDVEVADTWGEVGVGMVGNARKTADGLKTHSGTLMSGVRYTAIEIKTAAQLQNYLDATPKGMEVYRIIPKSDHRPISKEEAKKLLGGKG